MALSGMGLGITVCASYLGGHLSYVRGVGVNNTAFEQAVTEWTDVAAVSALSPDKPMRVTAGEVPVVLVQHDGALYALSATLSTLEARSTKASSSRTAACAARGIPAPSALPTTRWCVDRQRSTSRAGS
jgi:hypothetical protein